MKSLFGELLRVLKGSKARNFQDRVSFSESPYPMTFTTASCTRSCAFALPPAGSLEGTFSGGNLVGVARPFGSGTSEMGDVDDLEKYYVLHQLKH